MKAYFEAYVMAFSKDGHYSRPEKNRNIVKKREIPIAYPSLGMRENFEILMESKTRRIVGFLKVISLDKREFELIIKEQQYCGEKEAIYEDREEYDASNLWAPRSTSTVLVSLGGPIWTTVKTVKTKLEMKLLNTAFSKDSPATVEMYHGETKTLCNNNTDGKQILNTWVHVVL